MSIRWISTIFGRQLPLEDVIRSSVDEACRSYGFDMDPVLRKMIADTTARRISRVYTVAQIRGEGYAMVPIKYVPLDTEPGSIDVSGTILREVA